MGLARQWPEPPVATTARRSPLALADVPRQSAQRQLLSRAVDVVAAILLLLATLPLMVAGVILVLAAGGRPVFFGHERLGRWGRPFRCWKLRTMRADAEEWLASDVDLRRSYVDNGFKLPSQQDPRVLPAGRWLRRLYLDELPQLWNVLRGDMALVGPRPIVLDELEQFGDEADALLSRRPGVFGEWDSRGRSRPPYPERVQVEMEYVRDPSVARTLRILLRSVGTVVRGQGEEG